MTAPDWRGLSRYARAEAAKRLGAHHPSLEDVAQDALVGVWKAMQGERGVEAP